MLLLPNNQHMYCNPPSEWLISGRSSPILRQDPSARRFLIPCRNLPEDGSSTIPPRYLSQSCLSYLFRMVVTIMHRTVAPHIIRSASNVLANSFSLDFIGPRTIIAFWSWIGSPASGPCEVAKLCIHEPQSNDGWLCT